MNYRIEVAVTFNHQLKRLTKKYHSLKKEYAQLIKELEENPFLGTSIGNNCYKIRLAIASKGKEKSGGARVITNIFVSGKIIYLLSIYDKSEKENLSEKELQNLLSEIKK